LLGWYGGVAVEMMALGKPVIARIDRADAARAAPEEMAADLPIIDADPETITDVLRIWLGPRRGELASLGARGRRYVERWHDPRRIAQTLVNDYARILGRAPEDALCAASLGS
jgi:glycosyltransferase involved in cell wall biosynthesis